MDLISLGRPSITDEEVAAVERVLRSRQLVSGPEGRAFEEELAAACGLRHAAVVSSGTAALHLALWTIARGRREGERLLVPALTFPATANVAAFLSPALPVSLCDVDPKTFCARAEDVERHLVLGRGPVMVVHQFGYPAPLPPPERLGERAGLVLSDAACAIGVPGAMRGRAVCLSFHPRKILTTGEGGAVLSDDEGLIQEIRALRSHGLRAAPGQEVMALARPGLNYRLPEVAAAIGRVQLRRLPELIEAHRQRAQRYQQRLAGRLGLQADAPGRIWQTLAVVLPEGTHRPTLRAALRAAGIETQIASYGLHRLGAYAGQADAAGSAFRGADLLHERGLALPLHADLTDAQVDRVCDSLLKLVMEDR